ncbi:MAG: right-handed parallel beta-helix repeat-containing protein [Clostridia bacterium]|nr:right-handed parallel beta-helix repeat-containing protein [Clostridia bacterium]
MIYHVSIHGCDKNSGSESAPLRTINRAAALAHPGDTVIVHEGEYREWVDPRFGGSSPKERITYLAAPNEKVVIKGSEEIKGWVYERDGVWTVTLPNSFFGDYNPYTDVLFGDWYLGRGRDHHTGEVYLNGKSLYEVSDDDGLYDPKPLPRAIDAKGSTYVWRCFVDGERTTIKANFHGYDPNRELVEINVRRACFFPKVTGIDYITVCGFRMCHAATQWAPPTAHQEGLIGPNWSRGWIIENNIISDSKCVGISLGKFDDKTIPTSDAGGEKHSHYYQIESVFSALKKGWSRETVGSHIVRGNTIYNCEQAGIAGHMGCAFSQIYDNHIYNAFYKRQFDGAEIAGIKLHAAIDVIVKHNCIHNCKYGIWLDWQDQGARITQNLLYNNPRDLLIEVSHGPCLVDNNLFLSMEQYSLELLAQGTAFVHNVFASRTVVNPVLDRSTPYHFPHSTDIFGYSEVFAGDDRYYNNVFLSPHGHVIEDDGKKGNHGLLAYGDYPSDYEEYRARISEGDEWLAQRSTKRPIFSAGNLYLGGAGTPKAEIGSVTCESYDPRLSLEPDGDGLYLHFTVSEEMLKVKTNTVTTKELGMPRVCPFPYENPDGTDITVNVDYFGNQRDDDRPNVGAIEAIKLGENRIRVW